MDYRNLKHTSTDESPAQLFLGRAIRTRFDLMKPPLVKDRVQDKLLKTVENYKGRRLINFEKGQNVFVRDYTDVNKKSWAPAIIKEKNGPHSYQCILSNERIIKRHTDQIRTGATEYQNHNNDYEMPYLPSSLNNYELTSTVEPSHESIDLLTKDINVNELNPNTENETVNSHLKEIERNCNLTENSLNKDNEIEIDTNTNVRVLRPRNKKK